MTGSPTSSVDRRPGRIFGYSEVIRIACDNPPLNRMPNKEMVLPGGVHVKGKVLAVMEDSLQMRVTSTSNRDAWPKGDAAIPRTAVSVIRLVKRSKTWRAALTPGLPAALLMAMAVATSSVGPAPAAQEVVPIGMAVTLGSTVAGYHIGKRLDLREDTRITVIPDDPPPLP